MRYLIFIIIFVVNISAQKITISYRNLPKYPLINFKHQKFCYYNLQEKNNFKEIKSYFYQASGIDVLRVNDISKKKIWMSKCSHLIKEYQGPKKKYQLDLINHKDVNVVSESKTLKTTQFIEIKSILSVLFVPYLKKVNIEVNLNHQLLQKAFLFYKKSNVKKSIELLNHLKTMMEQKKFTQNFTKLEYLIYKSTLFQLALYYEILTDLNKAFLYYKLCLHHDLSNKKIVLSLNRIKQRLSDLPKLKKLLKKY